MNSDSEPTKAIPALIGLTLYYLTLKLWWGLPGPEWGYLNFVDSFMVNLFRAFLHALPTVCIFFYCWNQRSKEREKMRLWGEEQEQRNRDLKYKIREELSKLKLEINCLKKSFEIMPHPASETVISTEVCKGFDLQRFV